MNPRTLRGLTFATAIGLAGLVGFAIGRQSASSGPFSRADGPTNLEWKGSLGLVDASASSAPHSGERSRNRPLWSAQIAKLYADVEPGKPTPGFATQFKDAIDRGEPYTQGSMQMLLEGMRIEDLPQAFSLMKHATEQGKFRGGSGSGQQSIVWQAFWNRYGEIDPVNALAAARTSPDLDYFGKEFIEKNIFHGWAARDPQAAAQAFATQQNLVMPHFAVRGLTYEWAMTDLPAVTRWAKENLSPDMQSHAFCSMAYAVVNREGFKQGIEWSRQFTTESDRKAVLDSLKDMASRRGPAVSLDDRFAMLSAGRDLGFPDVAAEERLARDYAAANPAAGADLLTTLPAPSNGKAGYEAIGVLLQNWTFKDAAASGEWVSKQRGEPWYNSAAMAFAMAVAERDSDAAEQWINTIENEAMKTKAQNDLTQRKQRQAQREQLELRSPPIIKLPR